MPQNTHVELGRAEAERLHEPAKKATDAQLIREKAEELSANLAWLPNERSSAAFPERCRALEKAMKPLLAALDSPAPEPPLPDDLRWLYDNSRLLYAELRNTTEALKRTQKLPHVRNQKNQIVPRALALAEGFLDAVSCEFGEPAFTLFVDSIQQHIVLELQELWTLVSALQLVLLERIAQRGSPLIADRRSSDPQSESNGMGACIRSLQRIGETPWKDVVEPLIVFDHVLRQDPAGCYARMDFESRDYYRKKLSKIADHSNCTELEVARQVLVLAAEAQRRKYADPRTGARESHIGYYLVDKGVALVQSNVGYQPTWREKLQ